MNSKKQTVPAVPPSEPTALKEDDSFLWRRHVAVQLALDYHKNNGGMVSPKQVLGVADVFYTYLTEGVSK